MKYFLHTVLVAAILSASCSTMFTNTQRAEPAAEPGVTAPARTDSAARQVETVQDKDGMAVLEKVEFKNGVSSATVERLGRRHGCMSEQGAGLVTEKGPVEVYRMQCDNGTTFMAQCELRQCRPMH